MALALKLRGECLARPHAATCARGSLLTRAAPQYEQVVPMFDHAVAYAWNNVIHTHGMDKIRSLFKRAIKGTYVGIKPSHLTVRC